MYQEKIKGFLQTEYHYTNYECKKIKYVSLTILSEISKVLLLFIFFYSLERIQEFVVSTIVLLSVRIFTGGLHLKHYYSCFFVSLLLFFLGICILPELIAPSALVMSAVLILCIVLIYWIKPVPSSYRPVASNECQKRNSLIAATSILIYTYLIFLLPPSSSLYCGFWIIVLQTLQLGLAKIIKCIKES